ncbi:MAG TPA: glycosyltransferase, partial [Rhodocyclaceae bacterium]|nr:glycosyltransferase [Rhodocyclaceae bacterium]
GDAIADQLSVGVTRGHPAAETDGIGVIAVSIVSHGHGAMVTRLVGQLLACPEVAQIIVTRNVPEPTRFVGEGKVDVVENLLPKGFGANHNAAFRRCRAPFYCVLNPDIELQGNPFPDLLAQAGRTGGAVTAPLIVAPDGTVEDSARRFPTLLTLARKALGGPDGRYFIDSGQQTQAVDWVAGMFMLFASSDYAKLGGFDERYFLYYEDVDLCARAWRAGMRVVVVPAVSAVHDARRDSHRSFRHMRWHLASMLRFLASGLGSR